MQTRLAPPSADALAASAQLKQIVVDAIAAASGWISFARYMELALYTPGLGYYAGGSRKFGAEGDFVTAPEMTPLFGRALARQVAQILQASAPEVIEVGAGSGRLAVDLLSALDALGCAPQRYRILELSGELRARQAATLADDAPQFLERVEWLDRLPERISGCLVANELLDAMPTHTVRWGEDFVLEIGVGVDAHGDLIGVERPADETLRLAAQAVPVSAPYCGEIGLAARAWVAEIAERLECGAMLLIDYGVSAHELYHPQRNGGTVRCHYRHTVHDDAFWHPGLTDITSHVDFSAVAEAGFAAGLDVLGYASQANFLLNCGVGELLLAQRAASDGADGFQAQNAVNRLIAPNEMGELFKVIALGRGIDAPLLGFMRGDRVHTL